MLVREGEVRAVSGKGTGRRRRLWSTDEKRSIVAETRKAGASVSLVARRHDVAEKVMALELDSQGRFFMPAELRKAIGVKKEVELVGSIDRFEIWAPETYATAREKEKDYLQMQGKPTIL